MKVGDKFYCFNENDLNKKNSYYTILEVKNNEILITTDDDPNKQLNSNRYYFIHTPIYQYSKFSDHFINIKKYRQTKLNKLNKLKI